MLFRSTTATLPPDFSASDFPGLHKATAPYVVELSAGEMLYLPASWWHEVTSTSTGGGAGNVHMAFNYWFYPPDALERFEAPYQDELVWGHLRAKGKADGGDGVSDKPQGRAKSGKRSRETEGGSSMKKARW